MKLAISFLFLLTFLKFSLSFESSDPLSKENKITVNKYIKKDKDDEHSKIQILEDIEKITEDFSNDINTTKVIVKNLFLDIEASFEDVSDDIAKSVSKYSYSVEEKLNKIEGLVREFIENNKGIMFNSSESKEKVEKEKIKKVFNLILSKLKKLIHLSTMINYHTLLKFGNSDVKKETLEAVKNDDNISDELKKELIKYEGKENQDIKATELINFISPLYDNFTNKLNMLINELPTDLNQILK
ncbi:sporozoite protein essential for cell traversal, putative [Plasmodium malariae]|uniref:Sporozoite protein essential for cell traversal, putative n=1 Tax=Plasmodium malariae TaxID=5858 RepID=A0A1D3SP01_PLAMA|nr:sporozoite protein essential for cell traversal, putative [Plasmodium malariae]SCO93636.1 sporozoite protein essential for cell traversal, putative [Plasmodium malariae]